MVKYADWRTGLIPEDDALAPFMYKRKGFEYEQELRAIYQRVIPTGLPLSISPPLIWDHEQLPGVLVPVDVRGLVARVRLAPAADDWYREVVESVIARYGYQFEIENSELAGEPRY